MREARSAAVSIALRRTLQWGWLAALVGLGVFVFVAGPRAQPPGPEAPVLAADQRLSDAMRKGDKAIARRLLSLQFSFVDADGKIHTRRDFLSGLKTVAPLAANGTVVRSFGLLAAVTGHRQSARGRDVFFLDIWAKQKGTWRALLMQDVPLAEGEGAAAAGTAVLNAQNGGARDCKNPCQALPYRVRSAAEQDIVSAFQAIEKAAVAHDAGEWGKHAADEFVLYGAGRAPVPKADRLAMIERQKEDDEAIAVGEVESMRISVYGDGAAMMATQMLPDNSLPSFRAARVWTKRNGRWQLVISAQTDIK